MLWSLAVLALLASVQGRAVNISNTWVLPEEGFPVFYRYFRDRISWYEADAVCQFHHANLVTVDTTAQYDALRAYLKELDISSAVWVGLIRSNPDGDFTWTDYRGLSGDGYWSSAPDTRSAPLCAASDPTADYRWEARACGGPMVASFICELPVPQWASGSEGCMVRQIPALTILYLPESAAVQLTADCGLAGVKRVQCTGNIKREELLNNLSCGEPPEDLTTIFASEATISTASPETVTDLDTSQEETNGETNMTEREDVTQQERVQLTPIPNLSETKKQNLLNRISFSKDINLNMIHDNNLESNDIPKIANQNDNGLSEEEVTRLEDEKHMQHKILHNEYARLGNIGNFENIFSQPADHFVPPLVMAKARISDDMTVLSLEEKHAQQLAEQRNRNYEDLNFRPEPYAMEPSTTEKSTTTEKISTSEKPLIVSTPAFKTKDSKKYSSSKKYNEKYAEPKNRNMKTLEKSIKLIEKATTTQPSTTVKIVELTTTDKSIEKKPNVAEEDSSIDLSVIIREQADDKAVATTKNLPNKQTYSSTTQTSKEASIDKVSMKTTQNSNIDTQTEATQEMTHEVIKITILDEAKATVNPIVFEITTKVPVTEKSSTPNDIVETTPKPHLTTKKITTTPIVNTDTVTVRKIETATSTQSEVSATTAKLESVSSSTQIPVDKVHIEEIATTPNTHSSSTHEIEVTTVIVSGPTINNTTSSNATTANGDSMASTTQKPIEKTDIHANTTEDGIDDKLEEIHDGYDTSTHLEEAIDDLDSPLLSAANEPLHRPNRSRRPQQPPNRNKFNPFRILG